VRPFLPLALLLMAAPGSSLATTPGVIARDGVEVTILPMVAPASGPASQVEVGLDVEARTDGAAHGLGSRSLGAVVSVDCAKGANRFVKVTALAKASLKGEAKAWPVSGDWVTPAPDSYMAEVAERVCHATTPASAGPAIIVTAAPSPPPASAAPATPAAAPPVAPHALPLVVGGDTQPPAAAHPPATTSVVSAPAPSASVKPPANVVAQVAASPTAKGAQRVLASLRSLIVAPLVGAVEPATVDGAQVYRANVTGFDTAAAAKSFCVQAASVSKTCWVRRPPAAKRS